MYNPAERPNCNQPMIHYVAKLQHQCLTESYFPLIQTFLKMHTLHMLNSPKKECSHILRLPISEYFIFKKHTHKENTDSKPFLKTDLTYVLNQEQ